MRAVDELNDKEIDGKPLYVREALKKSDRDRQKFADKLRYKNSKKRCNLYVKNFPPTTTKEELENLFKDFGTIENIKLNNDDPNKASAFICFKSPEEATKARSQLQNYNFGGK